MSQITSFYSDDGTRVATVSYIDNKYMITYYDRDQDKETIEFMSSLEGASDRAEDWVAM